MQEEIDIALFLQPMDMYYLAGTIQSGVMVVPAEGEAFFLVQKNLERARMESALEKIIPLPSFKNVREIVEGETTLPLKRIGLELDVLPANVYLRLQKQFDSVETVDCSPAIRHLRMIKSPYEIEQMRKNLPVDREVFAEIRTLLREGMAEWELAAEIEYAYRKRRHQGVLRMRRWNLELFYGPVVSGLSGAYPTYFDGPVGAQGQYAAVPQGGGERRIKRGDPVMVDMVCGINGYCTDKARTYCVGDLPEKLVRMYDFILKINREIEQRLCPGTNCEALYQEIMKRVEASEYKHGFMGCGENQVSFLGHGVGLEVDELPVIAPGMDICLAPGMTIAVEPKIFMPGEGGVGIENTYLITEDGFEKLSDFDENVWII